MAKKLLVPPLTTPNTARQSKRRLDELRLKKHLFMLGIQLTCYLQMYSVVVTLATAAPFLFNYSLSKMYPSCV